MRTLRTPLDYNVDDRVQLVVIEACYITDTYAWFLNQNVYSSFEIGDICISESAGMGKSTLAYTAVKAL